MIKTAPAATTLARARGVFAEGRLTWSGLVLTIFSILIYLFLYAPIVILVIFSFTRDEFGVRWTGFTLDWYIRLFNNPRMMGAAWNTLVVASVSTVVSTIIGTLLAMAMERYRFRGRGAMEGLIYLPIVVPEIVMAVALLAFSAIAFDVIKLVTGETLRRNLTTVTIGHIAFSISFVVVVVRTSLKNFDRRLEEAAADLGANSWNVFWRITFPLILPGIIGGALLAFTLSLDDFIISLFLSGPGTSLLPVEVYNRVRRAVTPEINAISTLMLLLSMVLVALSQLLQRRR
ncbi:ABC transporter permease [Chloroflexus sp. MS-CIW-1]|jgi:spermidine/putrescine transport system permease protein|uniref:ABC transporter permease n=1 Tax=Chloroflexus sp. MS-CIW-1 TaxID=3055768 RepID=UPI001B12B4BC|nr:ABC transporter permease [Chloroflexus sp. MS-CIW-1]MBO9318772.1 ABC transporter permease [Chloroflexus sp.]MBO9348524.1 ABC transporter permease [Chloroflexus sp.]MDN5271300.1 ABC transporter permease [Chloroflexus sp. MS-CIW-1]